MKKLRRPHYTINTCNKIFVTKEENWRKKIKEIEEALQQATIQALKSNEEIGKLKEKLVEKEKHTGDQEQLVLPQGTSTSFTIPWGLSLIINQCRKENSELLKQLNEIKE